jgi:heme-degrading monooxygenase HmoA
MRIRVTPGKMQPGKMGEANAIMREAFAAYGEAGGFLGGYVGGDDASGDGYVVTLWESDEAARAGSERARPILARLAAVSADGAAPTPPPSFEVLVQA